MTGPTPEPEAPPHSDEMTSRYELPDTPAIHSVPSVAGDPQTTEMKGCPKSLLDLPSELLEMVAENSDRQALQALRLVCRKLQAAADRQFIDTFFTHRCHMDTMYSLETLASITAVPRLRDRLQSLTFVNATLAHADPRVSKLSARDKYGDVIEKIRDAGFPETRQQQSEFDRIYKPWNGKLRDMKVELHGYNGESGVGLRSMTEIFNNLKAAGIYPTIRVGHTAGDFEHVFGSHELAERFGVNGRFQSGLPERHGSGSMHFTTAALMRGLTASKFPVTDLALVDDCTTGCFIPYFRDAARLHSLRTCWSNLSSLGLCLRALRATWTPEHLSCFEQLIKSNNSLDSLSLSVDFLSGNLSGGLPVLFGEIFSQCNLKSVTLEVEYTIAGELFEMLEPHKATLECLTLQSVHLDEGIPLVWSYSLKKLADSFTLRKVIFRDVREEFNLVCQEEVIEGTVEEVRAGLIALAVKGNDSEKD